MNGLKDRIPFGSRANEYVPNFFHTMDAARRQDHLIRSDPHRPGEISHFIAVPLEQLAQYVQRRDIDESVYIWELRSMTCARLRKLCSLLRIKGASSGNAANSLKAILQQPGNRTFSWERYKEAAYAHRRPTVEPEVVLSSVPTPPRTQAVAHKKKKPRPAPPGEQGPPASVPALATGAVGHGPHILETVRPVGGAPAPHSVPSPVGPMTWEAYARIIEQHRRSIELKRNQEFAYYREMNSISIQEAVRRQMRHTLESIQNSILAEERALQELRARCHACIARATHTTPPAVANIVTPRANAKTTGMYD